MLIYFFSKNDVTLTRHDVMTRSHRKSRLAPFRAENIFRKSHKRNFGCWWICLSNRQKCALGGNFTPLALEGLKSAHCLCLWDWSIFYCSAARSYYHLMSSFGLFSGWMVGALYLFREIEPNPMKVPVREIGQWSYPGVTYIIYSDSHHRWMALSLNPQQPCT